MTTQKGQSSSGRKYGRNANYCLRYRNEDTRRRNKVKRIKRHLKRYPKDGQSIKALERHQ